MSHDRRCRELADYFLSFTASEETRAALAEHIQIEIEKFRREHDNEPHHRSEQSSTSVLTVRREMRGDHPELSVEVCGPPFVLDAVMLRKLETILHVGLPTPVLGCERFVRVNFGTIQAPDA